MNVYTYTEKDIKSVLYSMNKPSENFEFRCGGMLIKEIIYKNEKRWFIFGIQALTPAHF